eukprot:81293-Prorocentrum_lima.AAC.1
MAATSPATSTINDNSSKTMCNFKCSKKGSSNPEFAGPPPASASAAIAKDNDIRSICKMINCHS